MSRSRRSGKLTLPVNPEDCKYQIDDIVYTLYKGDVQYEARIQDAFRRTENGGIVYNITYKGWGNRYNEQIDEEKLMPDTEEVRAKQREQLDKQSEKQMASEEAKPTKGLPKKVEEYQQAAAKDGQEATGLGEMDYFANDRFVISELDAGFRSLLLLDYQRCHSLQSLLKLPREETVSDLVDKYLNAGKPNDNKAMAMSCLLVLFDAALPVSLLYASEAPQYARVHEVAQQVKATPVKPSRLYGLEHLLRLLVRLGPMVRTQLSEDEYAVLQTEVDLFVQWLTSHSKAYIVELTK